MVDSDNGSDWETPTWLDWIQIVWNVTVGVGLLLVVSLGFAGLAEGWMVGVVVATGLPCALLNHILAEREGRELPPE